MRGFKEPPRSIQQWGPSTWHVIHMSAYMYPDTPTDVDKSKQMTFLTHVADILPCPTCRSHFRTHVASDKMQAALESKDSLFEYIVDIHNEVNVRRGRDTIPVDLVQKRWDSMAVWPDEESNGSTHQKNCSTTNNNMFAVIVVLGVVVLGLLTALIFRNRSLLRAGTVRP